jgi:hypothetical protein
VPPQWREVIFATTTPILSPGTAADNTGTEADSIHYNDAWVQQYNAAAKALMAEENVTVNDLYALCKEGRELLQVRGHAPPHRGGLPQVRGAGGKIHSGSAR